MGGRECEMIRGIPLGLFVESNISFHFATVYPANGPKIVITGYEMSEMIYSPSHELNQRQTRTTVHHNIRDSFSYSGLRSAVLSEHAPSKINNRQMTQ